MISPFRCSFGQDNLQQNPFDLTHLTVIDFLCRILQHPEINPESAPALTTQKVSKWLVQVLTLAGIDNSTSFIGHSTRAVSTLKAKSLGVPTREILKREYWSRNSTFQKYYQKEIKE